MNGFPYTKSSFHFRYRTICYPKMLTLKSICLLKVSQLDLPYDGIPKTLSVELIKMKCFNGNFFGSHGEEENYSKKTVLTIQYLGEKTWAFQMNYTTLGGGPEELFDFVFQEDKPLKTGFSICRGLSSFGYAGWSKENDKQAVSTVLAVDKECPGKLVFKTTRKKEGGFKIIYTNKFQIKFDSDSSRVLTHGLKFGNWSGLLWIGSGEMFTEMVECAGW